MKTQEETIVAYIVYMCDQDAPSRPNIARVRVDHLFEDLKKLAIKIGYKPDEITIEKATDWGDIRIFPKEESDVSIFVTFDDKEILKKFLSWIN